MRLEDEPLLAHRTAYLAGAFLPEPDDEARTLEVRDPASGARLARLPSYGAETARAAVEAAAEAVESPAPLEARRGWLLAIAEAHATHREPLARILTAENGKPLVEARGEVDYAAAFYRDAAGRLDALAPRRLSERPRDHGWTVHARPAGVAGLITPWNFPLAMHAKKVSAALAAGAPFVLKPSELTPLSALAFFQLLDGLGLPPGTASLVWGDAPAIGEVFCTHPAVRVLSFTGSTEVGRRLATAAAPHMKRLALELGGNAPFLVFADADLDSAVAQLMGNKFRCSGQTCVCTNRVLVEASVAEAFAEKLAARVGALRVGPGAEAGVQIGPLIDRRGFDKVHRLVADALDRGATARVGGLSAAPDAGAGCFFTPTVLDRVTPDMAIAREEAFGPVVALTRFDGEDEAVRLANATEHGLAAYLFTGDPARAERVLPRLRFGHVGLNSGTGPTPEAPFGGMKMSGLGREGGIEGLLEYVELQTVAERD